MIQREMLVEIALRCRSNKSMNRFCFRKDNWKRC